MALTRRSFLLTTAAAFATPLEALNLRLEAGVAAAAEFGYGPLRPVKDATTGMPLLELPDGFRYMSFGWTGDPMDDGRRIPPLHDGMAAFAGENGRVVLVRNHELGPGVPFGTPTYDSRGRRRHHDDGVRSCCGTGRQHACQPYWHVPQLRGRTDAVGIVADV